MSPYDVRQGGFSGGAINAVTKSGSNGLHGNARYVGRNQKYIGTIPAIATPGTNDAYAFLLLSRAYSRYFGSMASPAQESSDDTALGT